MTWHAVDGCGRALATGRAPAGRGHATPAAALAGAPVVTWPLAVVAGDGTRLGLGRALGRGGQKVEHLLDALAGGRLQVSEADAEALAGATPAGPVRLPLVVMGLAAAVEAAVRVDPAWLATVEQHRSEARQALLDEGRDADLEAALHVAMLMAAEVLPFQHADVDAHVASGARLWLLTGAVASALAAVEPDAFAPWGWLVAAGLWPIGPSDGRLVVGVVSGSAPGPRGQ